MNRVFIVLFAMAATRRYEAAGWLRRMVGVVGARDLPEEPTEEEFRLGLRNGIVLCNALNKVQPGAVPKVVEAPVDPTLLPDGAALSAYQYFENLRNFLDALEELGLPTFEASDLERGGKGSRVVNCVLALKSHGLLFDRQKTEIQVRSCSALMQERVELDLQDLLTVSDSSSWPERYPKLSKFGSKETGEDVIQNEDALSAWEGENPHVPDSFYQGYIPDVRAFRDEHTSRANSVATEDLDDLDFAMSESSEQDVLSQSSLPKSSNAVNRIKRPQSGAAKSSDVR
ncbi:hypothetical protein BHE74_00022166 [Ensete ventricosum]|nr:hypothetical protein BHE74_00022166 [Ensete ventricosum]